VYFKWSVPKLGIILVIFSKHYCANTCPAINRYIAANLLIQETVWYCVTLILVNHHHVNLTSGKHYSLIITKTTNKMQQCRLIYYSLSALHVSDDVFAHRQEHLTVFTASGNIHQCRCWLVSWMIWNWVIC